MASPTLNTFELVQFYCQLGHGRLDNRDRFTNTINKAMNLLGYTPAEISQKFNCSRPTVYRWMSGQAAPFIGMRRVIFEELQKEITTRFRTSLGLTNY
jgi:transcriptional regulator with XRE-family HTH domain